MPELSTKKWVRYEPALSGNSELPEAERFYLEVRAGLSVVDWDAARGGFFEAWRTADGLPLEGRGERLAAPLDGVVRLGKVRCRSMACRCRTWPATSRRCRRSRRRRS